MSWLVSHLHFTWLLVFRFLFLLAIILVMYAPKNRNLDYHVDPFSLFCVYVCLHSISMPYFYSYYFLHYNCRHCGFSFCCLPVGLRMLCLRIRNREDYYLLHMEPHCITCLSYLLRPTIQMSGFLLTSECNHMKFIALLSCRKINKKKFEIF